MVSWKKLNREHSIILTICWIVFLAIAMILISGLPQDVPIKPGTGHWEIEVVEQDAGRKTGEIVRWVGEPDWDKVSWEVKIAHQYSLVLIPAAILIFFLALLPSIKHS